jgi:hypothetical protein
LAGERVRGRLLRIYTERPHGWYGAACLLGATSMLKSVRFADVEPFAWLDSIAARSVPDRDTEYAAIGQHSTNSCQSKSIATGPWREWRLGRAVGLGPRCQMRFRGRHSNRGRGYSSTLVRRSSTSRRNGTNSPSLRPLSRIFPIPASVSRSSSDGSFSSIKLTESPIC